MKFLVTGGSGLIGFTLLQSLNELKHEIYAFYNKNKPIADATIKINLLDSESVAKNIRMIKPDVIIHLAAITNVDQCESEKNLASSINTKATQILAQEASKGGIFLIYVSTDYVFDGKKGMYKEEDAPNPLSYYGMSKLEGEMAVEKNCASHCIVRTSTPFGFHPYKKSFPIWVIENLQNGNEIKIITDQFTSPTYTPNLSRMLIEIATKKISGKLHTAGATRISRFEFAKLISTKLKLDDKLIKPTTINETNWLAKRPKDSSLDVTKASKLLQEKPMKIEESLSSFIRDYLKQ
jgi:dTDP-4-dehydrorhamnose reductase